MVILNWNGEQFLRRFLPRVVATCEPSGAEVVVADNGSTDGSEGVVKGDFPSVRWLPLGENYGFADGVYRVYNESDFWGVGESKDGVLRIKSYVR